MIAGVQQHGRQRPRPPAGSAHSLGAGPRPAHQFRVRVGHGGPVLFQFQRLPHPPPRGTSESLHPQLSRGRQLREARLTVRGGTEVLPVPPEHRSPGRAGALRLARPSRVRTRPLDHRVRPRPRPPRGAPYLAIAAAPRAHWSRAGGWGAGRAGRGGEGRWWLPGAGRGEGGADPDVHSWAPGEVEAQGPAAGGRATDAGTGIVAAAATMVKGPPSRLHPGTPSPRELASTPSPTRRPGGGWGSGVGEGRGPGP